MTIFAVFGKLRKGINYTDLFFGDPDELERQLIEAHKRFKESLK